MTVIGEIEMVRRVRLFKRVARRLVMRGVCFALPGAVLVAERVLCEQSSWRRAFPAVLVCTRRGGLVREDQPTGRPSKTSGTIFLSRLNT